MRKSRALMGLLFLAVAGTAMAFTVAELQGRAETLESTYGSLYAQASACTSGHCSERSAIEAGVATAESDRTTLNADRATLGTCSGCQQLDSTLSSIDGVAAATASLIQGWDDQG